MKLNHHHRILTLALSLIAIICAEAQTHYSAVIQNGDRLAAFYGDSALIKANNAAISGDTIYLSKGNFKGTELTKSVTLFGAGNDTEVSYLSLNVPNSESDIYIEGIRIPHVWKGTSLIIYRASNVTFKKCTIHNINFYGQAGQISILNCTLQSIDFSTGPVKTLFVENSNILNFNPKTTEIALIKNSYIGSSGCPRATYSNCIIKDKTDNSNSGEVTYANCVLGFTPFDSNTEQDCTVVSSSEIDGLFKEDTTFELTDQAAATYKGDDGSQVGMYGGQHPFTLIPATPVITRAIHPSVPTPDGKLPLEITVEVRE